LYTGNEGHIVSLFPLPSSFLTSSPLKHPLFNEESTRVLLITRDPQSDYEEIAKSLPGAVTVRSLNAFCSSLYNPSIHLSLLLLDRAPYNPTFHFQSWRAVCNREENPSSCLPFVHDHYHHQVMSVSTLRKQHKEFEARRILSASHDAVVADEAVIPMLPRLLGKSFFAAKK
jgi:hypothetical protein